MDKEMDRTFSSQRRHRLSPKKGSFGGERDGSLQHTESEEGIFQMDTMVAFGTQNLCDECYQSR